MDHDDARAVHHADAHRGVGARGEPLGVDERAAAQLVEVEVGVAELQQAGAELVLARVAVLLDEAVRLKGLQQTVDRGRGRPSASASSVTPRRRGPLASAFRIRAARSIGLDRPPRLVEDHSYSALSNRLRWFRLATSRRVVVGIVVVSHSRGASPQGWPSSPRRWPGPTCAIEQPAALRTAGSAPTRTACATRSRRRPGRRRGRARRPRQRDPDRRASARGRGTATSRLVDAPLVEGAIAAAVDRLGGLPLDDVASAPRRRPVVSHKL